MLPDDATGSVYHGSPAHISRPLSASARADAVSACIDEKGKSRNRYPRGEWLSYAQRRRSGNASAHRLHIKGCCFGRASVILNEAGGGVKDLEFHSGFLEQILRCRSE